LILFILKNHLDSSHGARIDAADMVMRFNWPPLRGFERDVGRRTDFMVVGHRHTMKSMKGPTDFLDFDPSTHIIFRIQVSDVSTDVQICHQ
jgi:hypothetical protein